MNPNDTVKLETYHENPENKCIIETKWCYVEHMTTVKNITDDVPGSGVNEPIPLPNVEKRILLLVLQWIEKYIPEYVREKLEKGNLTDDKNPEQKNENAGPTPYEWETPLFVELSKQEEYYALVIKLMLAFNYLDCKPGLEHTCKFIANDIKGNAPEEIRKKFGLKNDFTAEEEEQIRKENEWCEER